MSKEIRFEVGKSYATISSTSVLFPIVARTAKTVELNTGRKKIRMDGNVEVVNNPTPGDNMLDIRADQPRSEVAVELERQMAVMVTGHRPGKLYGYDINSKDYNGMRAWFQKKFEELEPTILITGMALGVDQIFCEEALVYQDTHREVKIHAYIPCQGHSSKWREESVEFYDTLLADCDVVHLNDVPYSYNVMQIRNMAMVDAADLVLAVWDGSKGGTHNCLKYATTEKKRIHRLKV